jgi:aryl-alcohol dehydrogenase-like predicted oxidoreductase
VGGAIEAIRDKVIIVTKCGRIWDSKGKISGILTKENIRHEIEASLRRLNVDVIDLYLMHWPDPDKDIEQGWAAMADLIKEGKVRYIGVSNFSVEQLKRVQPIHPVALLEPPYSMLERGVEEGLLDYCAANNIGVIVYSPLQKGILTEKFTREWVHSLPHDDHRRDRDPHFQEPELNANVELVEALRSIAKKKRVTVAQLAIAWVLRCPEVTAAIVGARRRSQIEENIVAAKWTLSDQDIQAIDILLSKRQQMLKAS